MAYRMELLNFFLATGESQVLVERLGEIQDQAADVVV
jgi:hypothetical protein